MIAGYGDLCLATAAAPALHLQEAAVLLQAQAMTGQVQP